MLPQRSNVLFCRSLSITIAFGAVVMLLLFSACSGRHKDMGAAITERDSLPVMDTKGVMTLISDSGVTRYRINTEEWLVFDRKNPPYWAFEKGVYLEKFDSVFNVDASIKSDTAYYYEKQKLWKLMSNVHIQNLKGEKFDTDLLYCRGFDSNEQMTVYTIRKPEGIFYVDDDATAPADSVQTDSMPKDSIKP